YIPNISTSLITNPSCSEEAAEGCLEDPVQRTFSPEELQKVPSDQECVYRIEKILQKRGRGKQRELLVKWSGWPEKFNTRSLDLPGSWEIGLAEIQYPHSWHTLTSPGYFEIANKRKRWHFSLRSSMLHEVLMRSIGGERLGDSARPPEASFHH
ncbi:hypothetical protein L345_14727, partial [Ophiophagus hannah]